MANRFRDLLREFEELDEKNTRRLTQEDMYQLLKRWLFTFPKKDVCSLFGYLLEKWPFAVISVSVFKLTQLDVFKSVHLTQHVQKVEKQIQKL